MATYTKPKAHDVMGRRLPCDMQPWARAAHLLQCLPMSTQPCIYPGSLNRVPDSAEVRAGLSPLPGGR